MVDILLSRPLTTLVEGRTEMVASIDRLRIARVNAIRALVARYLCRLEDIMDHREGWNPKHNDRTSYGRDQDVRVTTTI